MPHTTDPPDLTTQMSELQRLLEQVDCIVDPAVRNTTSRIIQSLMDFHGAGLSSILERISRAGEAGRQLMEELAEDDLVSNLLLLYGLHPHDLESRVRAALEKCRPYIGSHGGNVELLGISPDGVVQIQMQGSCHGCPSSAITLKNSIEKAIYDKAPDINGIEVVELPTDHAPPAGASGFVPVEQLRKRAI